MTIDMKNIREITISVDAGDAMLLCEALNDKASYLRGFAIAADPKPKPGHFSKKELETRADELDKIARQIRDQI